MKKILSVFTALVLLLTIAPFSLVSAQESTTQANSSSIFQSYNPTTVTSETYSNDNISLQKAGDADLDFTVRSTGGLLAEWDYNNPGKVITRVDLTMYLEYREDFLSSWKTVDTWRFNYTGGLGSNEHNEHTFYPDKKGTYRAYLSGNIYHTQGGTNIQKWSSSRAYDPKIIISNDPAKIELK